MSRKTKKAPRARYYVTAEMLHNNGACDGMVDRFLDTFGERADVTPENVRKALGAGLYLEWITTKLWGKTYRRYSRKLADSIDRLDSKIRITRRYASTDREIANLTRWLNKAGDLYAQARAHRWRSQRAA